MNADQFTEFELDALALEVEDQLAALQSEPAGESWLCSESLESAKLPAAPRQKVVIEEVTGEAVKTFWVKVKRLIRKDVCLPSGYLNKQWKSCRDLSSKASLKVVIGALGALGVSIVAMAPLAIALAVLLINTVANRGLEGFCESCGDSARLCL